jgi:hypothetical protein
LVRKLRLKGLDILDAIARLCHLLPAFQEFPFSFPQFFPGAFL